MSWFFNEEEVDDRKISMRETESIISVLPSKAIVFPNYKNYFIDFDKVNNLQDVIAVLKSLNIQFSYSEEDEIPEDLKPYLKESDE